MPRNGRAQINIAVDPDLKSDWKRAVDETGRYDSITQLIRQSVENELTRIGFRESMDYDIPDQGTNQQEVDLTGIEEELAELKREIKNVGERVEQIDLATEAQQDSELMELASQLHAELPRVESEEELYSGPRDDTDGVKWEAEKGLLSHKVDDTEYNVTRALSLLEQQVSRVKSTTVEHQNSPVTLHYVEQ
jgi:hypothetical protein